MTAEYNGANRMEDLMRLGITLTPNLGKGNFTMIRIYPYETSGEKGPQFCAFMSQQLSSWLAASVLGEFNVDDSTLYTEQELDLKLNDNFTVFLQGRGFGSIDDKIEIKPFIGVKYTF